MSEMAYESDENEAKIPTPSPSHSSSHSNVSAAMLMIQDDGFCTYAYYDESSWNDNMHSTQQLQFQDKTIVVDNSVKVPHSNFRRSLTTDSESSLLTSSRRSTCTSSGGRSTIRESFLNRLNYFNFVCLIGKCMVVCLVGLWRLNGNLANILGVWVEQQTLISPTRWSLLIWPVTLVLEIFFALLQLTPSFRARPIVQEGTSYFFGYSCISQIGWMLFFSLGMFLTSLIFILITLGSLISLKISQDFVLSMYRSNGGLSHGHNELVVRSELLRNRGFEYWLLRFPFLLHLGWTIVIASETLVVFVIKCGSNTIVELTMSFLILSIWLLVAFFFGVVQSSHLSRPLDLTIPCVMIWAFIGVGIALRNPTEVMADRFNGDEIAAVSATAFGLAILVGLLMLPHIAYELFREQFTIQVSEVH